VGSWFGHTADPTLGDLVLIFLFVLLAVSALAPPARNHSAFVSFLFVADLLVFRWLFFFADFFVFIATSVSGKQNRASSSAGLNMLWIFRNALTRLSSEVATRSVYGTKRRRRSHRPCTGLDSLRMASIESE
jgi:hypothetical protein